jgi:hypothetical protein
MRKVLAIVVVLVVVGFIGSAFAAPPTLIGFYKGPGQAIVNTPGPGAGLAKIDLYLHVTQQFGSLFSGHFCVVLDSFDKKVTIGMIDGTADEDIPLFRASFAGYLDALGGVHITAASFSYPYFPLIIADGQLLPGLNMSMGHFRGTIAQGFCSVPIAGSYFLFKPIKAPPP